MQHRLIAVARERDLQPGFAGQPHLCVQAQPRVVVERFGPPEVGSFADNQPPSLIVGDDELPCPLMVERQEAAEPDLGSQFAAGDDGVLKVVYAAHGALVYSYCRRMLDAGRAADATHEVFVGAWRSRGRYRPEAGTLAGWLIGMARFTVIDILRADEHQPTPGQPQPRDSRPVAGDATNIAMRMLVGDAIAALPERTRTTVRLAIFEDLTPAQIAERCDLALDTVKSDIHRGVQRIRRHLEGFEHAA